MTRICIAINDCGIQEGEVSDEFEAIARGLDMNPGVRWMVVKFTDGRELLLNQAHVLYIEKMPDPPDPDPWAVDDPPF